MSQCYTASPYLVDFEVGRSFREPQVVRYKVEPYVVCADVYGVAPHTGRCGWTWYTGSAAWLYRVGLEAILGFRLQGKRLEFNPCVPPGWAGYEVAYRHRSPRAS